MQIFSLLARRKHNNELFFCTPNLVRKTNKSKLQLLKIIQSASVNVSVLSDKGLLYSSLQYQHIRVASFSREIPCQTSQAFDLNLALHSGTLLCFELLELIKRKEQVFFQNFNSVVFYCTSRREERNLDFQTQLFFRSYLSNTELVLCYEMMEVSLSEAISWLDVPFFLIITA